MKIGAMPLLKIGIARLEQNGSYFEKNKRIEVLYTTICLTSFSITIIDISAICRSKKTV